MIIPFTKGLPLQQSGQVPSETNLLMAMAEMHRMGRFTKPTKPASPQPTEPPEAA